MGILNIVKVAINPKLICSFHAIPIKIPAIIFFFFADVDRLILKSYKNAKDLK